MQLHKYSQNPMYIKIFFCFKISLKVSPARTEPARRPRQQGMRAFQGVRQVNFFFSSEKSIDRNVERAELPRES